MSPARRAAGLLLAALALVGCGTTSTSTSTSASASIAPSAVVVADDGIPDCPAGTLPGEALEVVEDIEAGGPYEYPRNDGVRFGNREGLLPDEDPEYYREFTVETPGLDHRGARRIVTGGPDERAPERWYYTDDHYESFCEFTP